MVPFIDGCPKHKRYKGTKKPRVNCQDCWDFYERKQHYKELQHIDENYLKVFLDLYSNEKTKNKNTSC